jgi:mannitol/fructose-specific phosphotransferase system IIA component
VVVGIAAIGDEQVDVLSRLAEVVEDDALTRELIEATDPAAVVACLNHAPAQEGP